MRTSPKEQKKVNPQIVKLTPPNISRATILEKIIGTRPMRQGRFNLSVERVSGKLIINCYGMGGAGWTTLFGSVEKAISLFKNTKSHPSLSIRVIGSGCFGLTTAVELSRRGYHVSGITTKSLYEIPSWKAAGYFALVSVKTSPEEQAELHEIGMNTFRVYQAIEQGTHPYITKDAVKFMPVYCSKDTDAGVEDLEKSGLIPPKEEVSLDFGNGVVHHDYLKYMTYFMNTTALMQELVHEVGQLGVKITLQEVHSFDEIHEDIIFNCSGLGGRELNSDDKMIPVRGHLIGLNDLSGTGHMEYMIYTKVRQDGRDEYVYLFPKNVSVTEVHPKGISCKGILGGSFVPNVDKLSLKEQQELDEREFERLLERNSQFFLGHPLQD